MLIFGGTGFLGAAFAEFILSKKYVDRVYLFDIEGIESKSSKYRKNKILSENNIYQIIGDVRNEIKLNLPGVNITLIANFAAVHREPGHEENEYYQTNILGAKNICDWAEKVDCNNIIFSSSISTYGNCASHKDENSLTVPNTAYGGSKLVAEKIHCVWHAKNETKRHLIIIRPGVIFGPGEGGNVSRLIKAVLHRYFFYSGNQDVRKAGIYVNEVCNAIWWGMNQVAIAQIKKCLFNVTMNPPPTMKDYVDVICRIENIDRYIYNIPHYMLLIIASIVQIVASPFKIHQPLNTMRIKKLRRSNNILPTYLKDNNYEYKFTLESAFREWKANCPDEWR